MLPLINRLKHRDDTEHEQALFRLLGGCAWLLYISIVYNLHSVPAIVIIASCAYIISDLLIFAWIIINPDKHPVRRVLGMFLDNFYIGYVMLFSGRLGAPLFGGYLFTTFGQGFRFGRKYLFLAVIMNLISFSIVMSYTDYWQTHTPIGIGICIAMIVLTAYVSMLITRLQTAISAANAANREKSQFLANMSHEIRTPLHAVIGLSDLLTRTTLSPEQKDFSATIQTSAKSLLALINDILDISKIEAGKTDIENIDFDLHGLINSTARILGPEAAAKGLAFRTNVSPDVPFLLRGDPQHLKQVLINLIHNAIKFTDKGYIRIDVSLLVITPQTAKIKFMVADTGIGIPENAQSLIFNKFTQVDQSDTRKYGGTGLGMAIAKQLVEAMGGTIGFSSKLNEGSVFWFELDIEQQGILSEEHAALPQLNDLRVLLINPDNEYGRVVENHLSNWGIFFDNASTAEDGVKRISTCISDNNPYHIIIVFLKYLDADPLQLLRQLTVQSIQTDRKFILIDDRNSVFPHEATILEYGYACILNSNPSRLTLFRTIHALIASQYYYDNKVQPDVAEEPENYRTPVTGLKILVGEDNPTNQMVIRKILEYGQHTVTLVANGEHVLDALENDNYDLLILDMHMPVINGIDVIKIMRFTLPDKQMMPVLMLTANATKESVQQCHEAGFDAYLTKPVEPQKLLSTVTRLVTDKLRNDPDTEDQPLKVVNINNLHKTPLLDMETLTAISRVAKSQEFMVKLVDDYVANSRNFIDQINVAMARKKYGDVADLAHTLYGSSRSIGASRLGIIADKLAGVLIPDNRFMAQTHLNELNQTFTQTRYALYDFLQGRNTAAL